MNTANILAELRSERDRISQAISALEALEGTSAPRRSPGRPKTQTTQPKKRRGGLTAAGRRRLSEMMKKRWAERRKNAKPKGRAAAA
jgi:hypothetical protein